VGIFVNKKFVEAMVPPDNGKFLDYALDSKALGLPEGATTIEAVLYIDFAERPRVVDRSSVTVSLSNNANIPIPEQGFSLRYDWSRGHTWVYDWDETKTLSSISEAQALQGSHAAESALDHFHARYDFEMDNVYDDGDALVRVQMEPPAGAKSVLIPIEGAVEPRRLFEPNLYPVYMRLHRTGAETYGLIPSYWGIGGGAENAFNSSVNIISPTSLPLLPVGHVKPGDSWFTRIQVESPDDLDRDKVIQKNSLFDSLPARGEFLDVEWQMGFPCAKIRDTFSVGTGGPGIGKDKIKTNAVNVEETYWFALDRGVIVRFDRTVTSDELVNAGPAGGAAGAPSPAGGGGRLPAKFGGAPPSANADLAQPMDQFGRRGGPPLQPGSGGSVGGGSFRHRVQKFGGTNPTTSSDELQRVTDTKVFTLVH
jgi:hypothetical protein